MTSSLWIFLIWEMAWALALMTQVNPFRWEWGDRPAWGCNPYNPQLVLTLDEIPAGVIISGHMEWNWPNRKQLQEKRWHTDLPNARTCLPWLCKGRQNPSWLTLAPPRRFTSALNLSRRSVSLWILVLRSSSSSCSFNFFRDSFIWVSSLSKWAKTPKESEKEILKKSRISNAG